MQIRRGERTDLPTVGDDWPGGLPTGLGGDRVENAQQFLRNAAERDPRQAEKWAAELRGNPHEYAEKVGLEADNIRGIATQMEQGAARMKDPQVGDLIHIEPVDPSAMRANPYSGRVIAKLDTQGGDIRYHLRTEVGPDRGMEVTVYGRDVTFRRIDLQQAYGFDRNSPEHRATEVLVDRKENARKQGNPDPEKINAYEAKQQARRERYRALAEKLRTQAQAKLGQAHKMAEIIPPGQPIHVGHHSENRDRRYRARIHDTFGKGSGLLDRAKYYERRSESMSNAISSDDPAAVQKLKEKLENLKKNQERMKAANALFRKDRTREGRLEGMEQLGFSGKQATDVLAAATWGGRDSAPFSLTNNNAEIRRIEERIKGLEKAENLQDRTTEYRWGSVRENKENNRIQFLFDGKPDEAARKLMKESGFRWAPSEEAWQRQWTGNAVFAARETIRKLNARMTPEQAGQVLESAPAPAERRIAPVPPVQSELPDSAGASDRLAKSLEVLEQHSMTITRADGASKIVNARRYLDEGVARGFTQADTTANPLAWVNPETSTRLTVLDDALAATLRAAHAVDSHVGRAIQSVARQKTDLEWEM